MDVMNTWLCSDDKIVALGMAGLLLAHCGRRGPCGGCRCLTNKCTRLLVHLVK
jgi:hypothetical protein